MYPGPQTADYKRTDKHGTVHEVQARRTTYVGFNPHGLPEGRVLELSSVDANRARSTHRAIAKQLGWTVKQFDMIAHTGRPNATLRTYWLPPTEVTTDSLKLTEE